MSVLITGSEGSLGRALREQLLPHVDGISTMDIVHGQDVTRPYAVAKAIRVMHPTVIYHLAGAKHAPDGERDPYGVTRTNVIGTQNILEAAAEVNGCRVVLASTCKACDPETAYGASKLIAERMVLNAGHNVARFYNIRESSGNVFEIWAALGDATPLPATDCWRYFINMAQAVALLRYAAEAPSPARYTINPGPPRNMRGIAAELRQGRDCGPGDGTATMGRRRGDRHREPRHAMCEKISPVTERYEVIAGPHDPPLAQRRQRDTSTGP